MIHVIKSNERIHENIQTKKIHPLALRNAGSEATATATSYLYQFVGSSARKKASRKKLRQNFTIDRYMKLTCPLLYN